MEDCKIALILTPQVHCNLEVIEANGILLWEKETIFYRKSRDRVDPGFANTYETGQLVKVASRKDRALSARSEQRDRLHSS